MSGYKGGFLILTPTQGTSTNNQKQSSNPQPKPKKQTTAPTFDEDGDERMYNSSPFYPLTHTNILRQALERHGLTKNQTNSPLELEWALSTNDLWEMYAAQDRGGSRQS
jgi:hypothetical protein